MNLITRYRTRTLWNNVFNININKRTTSGWVKDFMKYLGAPEVVAKNKKYTITIQFNSSITEQILQEVLQLEYNSITFDYEFMNNMMRVDLTDASVITHYPDVTTGLNILELTAENAEIRPKWIWSEGYEFGR